METKICPEVEEFIASLEESTIGKVLRIIDLLEMFGNRLGMPHSKKIQANLFELRVRGKQEIRIFYVFHNNKAVLLHGFVKKTEKTPLKEIGVALKRFRVLTQT